MKLDLPIKNIEKHIIYPLTVT